ncbi:MAG: NHL repeat-containing protein [Planctomycetes bacterium]|nr:NHL repeat-containing protein [Planctomycetota bacterium]MBI3847695.1 NHL repeat-containing protein [Planctomycetota bacterium]
MCGIGFRRRFSAFVAFAVAVACTAARADELLVSGFSSSTVNRYDQASGAFLAEMDRALGAQGIARGPDGNLYVAAENANQVKRYDGATGAFLDRFVWNDPATPGDELHGLVHPTAVVFGPDGNLYVSSFETDAVYRFSGTTGAFLSIFVAPGSGGLDGPDVGMTFGPDGNLYVPSFFNHAVLRYDGSTGAPLGDFVPPGLGGLVNPRMILFRGAFAYVSGERSNAVLRYDATSGAFDREFVVAGQVAGPTGIAFGPDGNLYVASSTGNSVLRFDGTTGAPIDTFVTPRSGNIVFPTFLFFAPSFRLRLTGPDPGRVGETNALRVEGAKATEPVLFLLGTSPGSTGVPGCAGVSVDLAAPRIAARVVADSTGVATLSRVVPARASGVRFAIQALGRSTCRPSNLVDFTFP